MKVTVYLKFLFLAILANSNPQCLILPGIIFPLHKRSLIGFYKARPSRVGVCDRTYSKKIPLVFLGYYFSRIFIGLFSSYPKWQAYLCSSVCCYANKGLLLLASLKTEITQDILGLVYDRYDSQI